MKLLRVWLLVLLALLLPVRGVMAAAMPCSPAATSHHAEAGLDGTPPCHPGSEATTAASPAADLDGCDLCSACGSAAPLPSAVVSSVPEPPGLRSTAAPEPGAGVPSFVCGGLERPPRSP